MRVLTDPAETGAVTLALPQDVQTEAFDVPDDLLAPRVWQVRRPPPEARSRRRAGRAGARRAAPPDRGRRWRHLLAGPPTPLSRAGGRDGHPRRRDPGGQGFAALRPPRQPRGARGDGDDAPPTASRASADVVIGVGTRWSDFTTASHSVFANPDVRVVNINVTPFDTTKLSGVPIVADARVALTALGERLTGWRVPRRLRGRVPRRRDSVEPGRRGRVRVAARASTRAERGDRRGRGLDERPRRRGRRRRQPAR